MKALRITGCTDPQMWYSDRIGDVVPYLGIWPESGYKSLDNGGYSNVVRFKDAEVVTVPHSVHCEE